MLTEEGAVAPSMGEVERRKGNGGTLRNISFGQPCAIWAYR